MGRTAAGKPPPVRRLGTAPGEVVMPVQASAQLAELVAVSADGQVLVRLGDAAPVAAHILGQITGEQLAAARAQGSPVLVVRPDGAASRLIVIGIVAATAAPSRPVAVAKVDGRRVELTGQDEVVLTCGKASITLTRAGKVIIKGAYVSSASVGVNRITGGSVQIN